MKKILLLMSVVLLACIGGYSQAPGIFNYQGVARNSVGNVLVNQSINLRLTIHDGSAGGAVVYQESRAAVTNPFGLFNVQVGSAGGTNVTGTIAGVPWGIGNKYLQVEIDPSGGTTFINIGTAQIASVPYSFYSAVTSDLVLPYNKTQADAGTLFKITNSGTGGSLEGLTNSTLANAFGIKGTVTSTAPGGFSTGVFGLNNGTGGLGIGVMGQQNGTGWGVYGVTPGGRGVYGSTTTGVGVYGDASSGTGVFGTSSTSNAGVFTITNAANNTDALQASTNGGPVSWAIRATSTGSQGAGIFQYNNGAGGASALRVLTNGTGFAANISSSNATPKALLTNGGVQLTGINEANNRILASDAVGNALWKDPSAIGVVTGSGTLNFVPKWTPTGTNLGNSIMFDNGTLVGVGTVTPFNTKLHVASDGNGANGFAGTRYTTPTSAATFGGLYVGLNFATGAQDVYIGTNETADMGFYTSGANRLNMTAAGNIGIGNTVPGSRFQVDNAGTNPTTTINQTNAANINIALGAFNSNVSNVNYGNSTILGQRGTGSLANTFLYVGIPTAITGIAATPAGFGVQGTSETGTGIAALTNSGVAFRAFANLAAAYAIQTTGRVQISGQGAGLNKVLTSDAIGNATWQTLGGGVGVGGSGTLNYVSKWTPDGFNLGNSQIFDNANSVGINTNTPAGNTILDMAKVNFAQVRLRDIDDLSEVWISAPSPIGGYTGGIGTATNHDFPLFTNGIDRVTVQATTGNVGIGMTTPTNKLEVVQTGLTRAGLFQVNNPASNATAFEVNSNAVGLAIHAQSNAPGFCNCGVIDGLTTVVGANAVYGRATQAGAWGVYGLSDASAGVAGFGFNAGSIGVLGQGWLGTGGQFIIDNTIAGNTANTLEVSNTQTGKAGNFIINNTSNNSDVIFATTNTTAVNPSSVHGNSGNSFISINVKKGVWGESDNGVGVFGTSFSNYGMVGASQTGTGMWGVSTNNGFAGIVAQHFGNGFGLYAISQGGIAGKFENTNAANANEVVNVTTNGTGLGIYATSFGNSSGRFYNPNVVNINPVLYVENIANGPASGVYSTVSNGNSPVAAIRGVNLGAGGNGVKGEANTDASSWGIWGVSATGEAGHFDGNVTVVGNFTATGVKAFTIDHPLDPQNKILRHAAVESNEVMNMYSGNIITDNSGFATVQLPDYFEAINMDFRYQLTVIGSFAQAIIKQKIQANHFIIQTSVPGIEVSWQVTAVRNDKQMQQHPFVAEEIKKGNQQGKYISPDLYGQSQDMGMYYKGKDNESTISPVTNKIANDNNSKNGASLIIASQVDEKLNPAKQVITNPNEQKSKALAGSLKPISTVEFIKPETRQGILSEADALKIIRNTAEPIITQPAKKEADVSTSPSLPGGIKPEKGPESIEIKQDASKTTSDTPAGNSPVKAKNN